MNDDGLGKRIRTAMGDESARSIARRAGISDSTLRSILSGSRPTVDNLAALARALGVSLDWLATGTDAGLARGVRVPVYAGMDALAEDAPPIDTLILPENLTHAHLRCGDGAIVAAKVGDDAMTPSFAEGDLALVDRACGRIAHDGLYVMAFEGTALLRRIQRSGAALIVEADNPAFRAWTIEAARVAEVRVVGRVAGAVRRI